MVREDSQVKLWGGCLGPCFRFKTIHYVLADKFLLLCLVTTITVAFDSNLILILASSLRSLKCFSLPLCGLCQGSVPAPFSVISKGSSSCLLAMALPFSEPFCFPQASGHLSDLWRHHLSAPYFAKRDTTLQAK